MKVTTTVRSSLNFYSRTKLPPNQTREFMGLWREFEERSTPEAKFAKSIDRFIPIMHNCFTHGKSWQEHAVTKQQVLHNNQQTIFEGSKSLW